MDKQIDLFCVMKAVPQNLFRNCHKNDEIVQEQTAARTKTKYRDPSLRSG
jgi:hypothetical protein